MSEIQEDDHLKFWRTLHSVLEEARDTLPYSDDPKRVYWDHPDEDWKNDAEVRALEQSCSLDTDVLVRHYCAKQAWPKRSKNDARYFVEIRIRWALGFIRIFTIPLQEGARAAIPRPQQSGWELMQWLLIEAYHQRFPPSPKTPFYISGPDGQMKEFWS